MRTKAVIFDLDGTLVDFKIDYKAARAEVISFLADQSLPDSILSINESVFDTLRKVKKRMESEGTEKRKFMELKKKVVSLIENYEWKAALATQPFPGILEALKTLKDMKIKIALFTANGEKSTRYVLERFRLSRFFETIITREYTSAVKPDLAHLRAVLRVLNVRPYYALVVGDSVRDVECARKLRILAVGVTTGIFSQEKLIDAGANYIASSAAEIPTLIQHLNKQK